LRDKYPVRDLLLTDSGTSALRLAIESIVCSTGGRVALPAYCCYDVATAAVGASAPVVLYDIDPTTLAPDPNSLRRAVQSGATAIVTAHLFGIPVPPNLVEPMIGTGDAQVIEDAAQGSGGDWAGRPLGSFGPLAILSFGRGKGMTGGSGGALLANTEQGAELLTGVRRELAGGDRGWSGLARCFGQWLLGRPGLYGLPRSFPALRLGETDYHAPWEPRSLAASASGLLTRTLSLSEREAERRRATATRLQRRLEHAIAQGRVKQIRVADQALPGYLRIPVLVPSSLRTELLSEEARKLGVMPGYPRPLHDLEALQPLLEETGVSFPGAEYLAAHLFTLPTHSLLQERDLGMLAGLLKNR